MLDYKDIIVKHYVLHLSGSEIARQLNVSKSGVNDFLRAFKQCENLLFPLPEGITNYGIAELVYGHVPGNNGRDTTFELPDFKEVHRQMQTKKEYDSGQAVEYLCASLRKRRKEALSVPSFL